MKLRSTCCVRRREEDADAQVLAAAEQVALADADVAERPVRRREAGAERQFAGRLLLDLDVMTVRSGAVPGTLVDVDLLEEAEVADALLRAAQLRGVEGVAFDEPELAADHLVERAHVADDVDALDIDARAFLDLEGDVDRARVAVAVDARPDVDEGVAAVAERVGQRVDRSSRPARRCTSRPP